MIETINKISAMGMEHDAYLTGIKQREKKIAWKIKRQEGYAFINNSATFECVVWVELELDKNR